MTVHRLMPAVLTALLCAAPAAAQRITGEIADPAAGGPVVGAFIRLLDAEGRFLRGVLSDTAGRFTIALPAPGRYLLRAERIGYTSVDAGPFDVAPGETLPVRMESGMRAIMLEGLAVESEKRCTTRPERAAGAARVWDEARKALELTLWAMDNADIRYRSTVYVRDLGPRLDVRDQRLRSVANVGAKSFPTVAVETIAEHGFARLVGDSIDYYGLDAEMLISDWFLDTHCFEVQAGDEDLIGLGFRPIRNRGQPDVEGTLWVERATGRLRWLDYAYVGIESVMPDLRRAVRPSDPAIPSIRMTGHTVFRRLESGIWIVDDWWIRVPVLGYSRGEVHLNGWRQQGGVVLEAVHARGVPPGTRITVDPMLVRIAYSHNAFLLDTPEVGCIPSSIAAKWLAFHLS
jgi:hypothetical protein